MAISLDDIQKIPNKYKILIGFAVFLLLGYLYFFFFFQPALDKRASLGENLETLEFQIARRQVIAKQIERHKQGIERLRENLKFALAKLPEQKEIPRLLTSVSEAGKKAGLEFILFEPTPVVSREFYAEIPVKIIIDGTFHDTALFFDSVASMPRIANITNINMKRSTKSDAEENILTTDCFIKIYMFLEMSNETEEAKKGEK
ncbi:MAG: type 4a pilus biogenesis protein PilO [Thermodesulfobacteriota bacterium]|nr:type 4a pilus biogenesis protein PilO [Thermodesulfobacteriota bacterium]